MGSRLSTTLRAVARWTRRFAGTAPGALGGVLVVTVALCLLTAFVGAQQLSGKLAQRTTLLEHTEPLADAAQRLYVALSAADATAATAFLSGGIESAEVRVRYQQSLADAATALAAATSGAGDEQTRRVVARVAADLPAYAGMVEAARANNRQGFPVGSSYLREASALMQGSLLPNAERLTTDRFAAVHDQERALAGPPALTLALLTLTLLACLGGSWILLRRTNRLVNLGVAAAAGATLLVALWTVAAGLTAAAAVDNGARTRFETLARARILAQQARAEETLELITRGDITAIETQYRTHSTQLRDRLTGTLSGTAAAWPELAAWSGSHDKQVQAYQRADYPSAVVQAIGPARDGSAFRFARLDEALRTEIDRTRGDLRDGVDTAGTAFLLSPEGVPALLALAAGAVALGIWPRLEEFL
ncbi:hypothetical protein D5S18_05810 [Nocardia panacis]|uniref:Secreted protein n=1 Tax=Nocardia panacis TaxID=2340916 RepID=A0A3A4L6T1_9NOCA|nr:hypothetical protein [Nocardia panacis]RJO78486.1 hypothetical protein D5S18_05810 [Nocardia panacis]